jgi:hypothetical protein
MGQYDGVTRVVRVHLDMESWEILEALATASGLGLGRVISFVLQQWLDCQLQPTKALDKRECSS